ncbi:MAG: heavy metal-binding domain-containing protein [Candidatus Obscuribacterales bacterium]|nr:heavy metal-binding domain-containing protein [Candidatus Obscuribacterales bacterium]
MPWWRFWQPETAEELQRNADQVEGIRALENGDIPPTAKRRIQKHLNRQDYFFSSDLTVREFLLCKEAGITPISQVMGTCNLNVSMFGTMVGFRLTSELNDLSLAQDNARALALQRMVTEAELLGASGVIGVRIDSTRPDLKNPRSVFTAYGTAVSVPGYPPGAKPFTSTLNGQEFWQLFKAGYHPAGVVMGTCTYYVYTDWSASSQMYGMLGFGNANNQEISTYTQAFCNAREKAMYRLTLELGATDADGVVDMQIDHHVDEIVYDRERTERRDLLLNFVALGTAVTKVETVKQQSPLLCIDLRKGKASATVTLEKLSGV